MNRFFSYGETRYRPLPLHFAMTNMSNATAWNLTAGVRQIYDATYAVCDPAALGGAMGSCRVITSNQRSGCFK